MRGLPLVVFAACAAPREAPPAVSLEIPPLARDAGVSAPPPAEAPPPARLEGLTLAARDPRMLNRAPKSRTTLLGEVHVLEGKVARFRPASDDRAMARRQLAEVYAELAYTSSGAEALRAHGQALEQWRHVRDEHPTFKQMDEVLYYLGLTAELSGDPKTARASWFDLIRRVPSSDFVPFAYFGFAELFFREAEAEEAKSELALQAYGEVLKWPGCPLYAYALLRSGQAELRRREDERAKPFFARLRQERPTSAAAAEIPPGF